MACSIASSASNRWPARRPWRRASASCVYALIKFRLASSRWALNWSASRPLRYAATVETTAIAITSTQAAELASASNGIALAPSPVALDRRDRPRSNRPVGQETVELIAKLRRRGVTVLGVLRDRRLHDRLQVAGNRRVDLAQWARLFLGHLANQGVPVLGLECRPHGPGVRKGSGPARRYQHGHRSDPRTARGPCSGSCPRRRRCGSGRCHWRSWPGRNR